MNKIIYILLLCLPFLVFGQSKHKHEHFSKSNAHYNQKQVVSIKNPLKVNVHSAESLVISLVDLVPNISNANELKLVKQRESLTASHYQFNQYFNGIEVYNATIRVSVDGNGRIIKIYDNSEKISASKIAVNYLDNAKTKAKNWITTQHQKIEKKGTAVIYVNNEGESVLGYRYLSTHENEDFFDLIFDINGDLALASNRSVYHSAAKPVVIDSTVNCSVYLPDPLTTSENQYGLNGFSDNNDAGSFTLNSERKTVEIKANYSSNNGFELFNDYVQIVDRLPPSTTIATSNIPVFDFTRDEKQFEDVNVYYHITAFQNYMQSLGMFNLQEGPVTADAHSLNGADNSRFVADAFGNMYLDFGDGGVDDAEDADVIIHEYIHALSFMANASNTGFERNALDEALGDYFATSYSRSISEYRWADMFTWDGHNEFWDGRSTNVNKSYPDDIPTGDIYGTAEIFSSCLMKIYEEVGREQLDLIVLESLFFFTENMSLEQAAEAILEVEQNLFGGENRIKLLKHFFECGFTDIYEIDAGSDYQICLGEKVTLGAPNIDIDGLEIQWTSEEAIESPNSFFTDVSPSVSSNFTLTITNTKTGISYSDDVFVTVDYCTDLTDDIILINGENFKAGTGDIFIQLSENTTYCDIRMYDLKGRLITHLRSESDEPVRLAVPRLITGLYILDVESNKGNKVFKVMKAN